MDRTRTIAALGAEHRRLLDLIEGADEPACEALAACVPQLLALIEERVPETSAVILRPTDVRELCTQLVIDVLEAQLGHLHRPRRRARPLV